MKGFHSAAALAALILAACADQGPTAPPLAPDGALGINGIQASLTDADENPLMIFMGGGIEGIPAGSDPGRGAPWRLSWHKPVGSGRLTSKARPPRRPSGLKPLARSAAPSPDARGGAGP